MEIFNLTTERRDDLAVAYLSGELDIANGDRVERELETLEQARPATLVVDLRGLSFMDSTGLRVLVSADRRAREAGRRLAIINGPPAVQRVFSITRLDERLDMVDDAESLLGDPA